MILIVAIFVRFNPKAKARLQVPKSQYRGPLDALLRTTQKEGFFSLYRGFGAVIVGGTPGTMAYLCSYEWIKERLQQKQKESMIIPESLIHFSAGMLAETIACLIYVPVDVIKERLQVQAQNQSFSYNGSFDALHKISKTEGISGLYKGYGATLASFGPYSALYFAFYEKFKNWSRVYIETNNSKSSFPLTIFCSASAGAMASWVTSPLDRAKLLLQIQRGEGGMGSSTQTYRSMIGCLSHMYHEAGMRGLFRGAGARIIHFAPAMTITMTCYEECRSFYANLLH